MKIWIQNLRNQPPLFSRGSVKAAQHGEVGAVTTFSLPAVTHVDAKIRNLLF